MYEFLKPQVLLNSETVVYNQLPKNALQTRKEVFH